MMAVLQDYRQIWRVAAVQRRPGTMKFMQGLALLLMLGAAVIAAVAAARHKMDVVLMSRILFGLGASAWRAILMAWVAGLAAAGAVMLWRLHRRLTLAPTPA